MKGYDVFYETPGAVAQRTCQVCGAKCRVEHDRLGPTGWAAALGKSNALHDYFYCPNAGQAWHEQALELVQAIESTPSKRIAALMQQDLIDLLKEHGY